MSEEMKVIIVGHNRICGSGLVDSLLDRIEIDAYKLAIIQDEMQPPSIIIRRLDAHVDIGLMSNSVISSRTQRRKLEREAKKKRNS